MMEKLIDTDINDVRNYVYDKLMSQFYGRRVHSWRDGPLIACDIVTPDDIKFAALEIFKEITPNTKWIVNVNQDIHCKNKINIDMYLANE